LIYTNTYPTYYFEKKIVENVDVFIIL